MYLKAFNRIINGYNYRKYIFKPSYTQRGWNSRKNKVFVNRFKHIQNYKPIFTPTYYSSSSIAL